MNRVTKLRTFVAVVMLSASLFAQTASKWEFNSSKDPMDDTIRLSSGKAPLQQTEPRGASPGKRYSTRPGEVLYLQSVPTPQIASQSCYVWPTGSGQS